MPVRLVKVEYNLGEYEVEDFQNFFGQARHGIDREIRLTFEGGAEKFLSWVQHDHCDPSRYDTDLHLEVSSKPLWKGAPVLKDMSSDQTWRDLVGRKVDLSWTGEHDSVLKISSDDASVWVTTMSDIIQVSKEKPGATRRENDRPI